MKYILLLVMVILICYVGHGLSKYYLDRQVFFNKIKYFLQTLSNEISFNKTKLVSAVRHARLSENNKHMSALLDQYEMGLKESGRVHLAIDILKTEETELLDNIFSSLGKSDLIAETAIIDNAINEISKYSQNADTEAKKYGGFYTKIALLLALALALLLI